MASLSEIRKPLSAENLLEGADGLLRPLLALAKGGARQATQRRLLGAVACCPLLLLTCALMVTCALPLTTGAPDIFSVYASINAGDSIKGTALALGELYGAGMFVTTIVVGVVSIVVPFKLTRRPFIRDVMAYLIAAVWSYIALWDGYISLAESVGFIGVYVLYVVVVILGRYIYQKNKKRKSASSLAIKRKVSKTEEMLPAPPRPQGMEGHTLSAALHAAEGMAVADAIALGPDLGGEQFTAAVLEARKATGAAPGPLYEDEGDAEEEEEDAPLLTASNDADEDDALFNNNSTSSPNPLYDHTDALAETLGDGTQMVDRRAMLEAQKDPWMELLEALNPIDVEEFKETAFVRGGNYRGSSHHPALISALAPVTL